MQKTTVQNPVAEQIEIVPVLRNITTTEMIELLMEQRGATFITFTHDASMSSTDKMRKTDNPFFGDCFKKQKVNGQVNFHYDDAVLRQLEREGKSPDDFKKGESWHEPIIRADGTLTPLCRHKKDPRKVYLRFRLMAVCDMQYHNRSGDVLNTEAVKAFVKERSDYANQGTEKKIVFNVWGLDDIRYLKMDGVEYRVVNG